MMRVQFEQRPPSLSLFASADPPSPLARDQDVAAAGAERVQGASLAIARARCAAAAHLLCVASAHACALQYLTFKQFNELVVEISSGLRNLGMTSEKRFNIYGSTSCVAVPWRSSAVP